MKHSFLEPKVCPTCDEVPQSFRGTIQAKLVREILAENQRLREALKWFADEGHYEGTYRHGAGFVDAVGLNRARAVLLDRDPDDVDGVTEAWSKYLREQTDDDTEEEP